MTDTARKVEWTKVNIPCQFDTAVAMLHWLRANVRREDYAWIGTTIWFSREIDAIAFILRF